ncbi:hypothetical protein MIMGU_mgv11b012644mg [Erythranthe guttata]|uniref:Uncharacterized protein n=1 Tax=Erythranthe guttata TaxID=4155 RepID=A0A022Q8N8_ERYGU|nr:hypothetical protein MIMGU_mgv11b012644mg [Erythranthe guttata]
MALRRLFIEISSFDVGDVISAKETMNLLCLKFRQHSYVRQGLSILVRIPPPPESTAAEVIFPFRRETLQTKPSYNPIGRFLYYHLVNISGDPLFFPIWSNESFKYSTRVVLNAFMALRRLFVEISSIPISSASSCSPFALCVYMIWTVSSITAYRGGRSLCPEFLA